MAEHLGGIRARVTIAGALVVALALAIGAVVFDRLLEASLVDDVDASITLQAADRARAISDGADPAVVVSTPRRETVVAIFDADDQITAASGTPDASPLIAVRPGSIGQLDMVIEESYGESIELETEQLRAAAVTTDAGDFRVVVATELGTVRSTLGTTRRLLAVTVPVLVALTTGLTWVLVGRALRPVERIRRDVEGIVGTDPGRRVTTPATNDEVSRLAATMNEMLDRLQVHGAARRQFVSDASHELRSPVANIRTRVETLDLGGEGADVIRETERLEAIIDDLTFLARSDEGALATDDASVHLDDILFGEAQRLRGRELVTVDVSRVEPVSVSGDAHQIGRMVRNLADNAEHHASSAVLFASAATDGSTALVVADDGPGVAAGDRDRIFERFTRVDGSRTRGEGGTGLGLAIVAQIAANHGAAVTVGEGPIGGAEFVVSFRPGPAGGPDPGRS